MSEQGMSERVFLALIFETLQILEGPGAFEARCYAAIEHIRFVVVTTDTEAVLCLTTAAYIDRLNDQSTENV
jgi:hypothetical protein